MNDDGDTILDLLKPRTDLTQFTRTSHQPGENPSTDDGDVNLSYGRVGQRPRMMLAFRKCSGEVEVFPYSLLSRIHSDDIDTGFTLTFGPKTIIVAGRKLTQLFRYVCEHRAAEITEADRTTALISDATIVVTSIRIGSGNSR